MTATMSDPSGPKAVDITVRGQRRGFLVPALLNVGLAAYNGLNWSQGHISRSTKVLTVFPLCLLALKGILLLKPLFMQLSGGRFIVRMGVGLNLATPEGNVAGLHLVDGKVRIRFQDLTKIEGSRGWKEFMQRSYSTRAYHLEFPLGKETDAYRSLRRALLRDAA